MKKLTLVLVFGFIFTLSVGVLATPLAIDIPEEYVGGQCGVIEDPWHYSLSGIKVTSCFRSNAEQMRLHDQSIVALRTNSHKKPLVADILDFTGRNVRTADEPDSWALILTSIKILNGKLLDPEVKMTKEDWKAFALFNLIYPRLLLDLVSRELDPRDSLAKEKLIELLKDHPRTLEEMIKGKKLKFFVAVHKDALDMIAFVYPRGHPKAYQVIIYFNSEGLLILP